MKRILFIAISLSWVSCDPARRINMKNETGQDAEVTWLIKNDSLSNSPFFMTSSNEVKFTLGSEPPYNLIKLSVGQGNWAPSHFNNIFNDLDSLIIRTNNGVIRLGTEELKSFLWPRRLGLDKGKISILLKE